MKHYSDSQSVPAELPIILIDTTNLKRKKVDNPKVRPLKNVQFCSSSRRAKILTTPIKNSGQAGIHKVFRGLKSESDAEIGQKGAFCKGL